jgi:DNA invertase Pin-like site-specific DNA recombinase
MRKVIQLIRVSTKKQAEDDKMSIPAQYTANRRICETYQLGIVHTIEYCDVSGAVVLMSPEIQELLRLIQSPEIHGVVTKEFSRLMRPEDFGDWIIFKAFQETDTWLYLPDGPINFNSRDGRLLGGLKAIIAGDELSTLRSRVWGVKEEKRRAGKLAQSYKCLPSFVGYTEQKGFFYTDGIERMREAYRLILSGETSYFSIAKRVGIEPVTLRNLLRNPIFMGWRIIDKKRDLSVRRVKARGRQGDRPKIKRAPEDVIRVKVINEPLVSEEEWNRVQQIMEMKRKRYWRANPNYSHRYTYNGFLLCSECGELIYTKYLRKDYYVCKGRYIVKKCQTGYMRRERLEAQLDTLLTDRLTDVGFLRELCDLLESDHNRTASLVHIQRIESEIESLQAQRDRIIDTFVAGHISTVGRDTRLAKIDRDLQATKEILEREQPPASLSLDSLVTAFAPLFEFRFLSRNDKRKLLSTIIPDIRVANYKVSGLYFSPPPFISERNHTDMDSSPPPA